MDAVLAKAIAKQPADRYPSCGAFVAALHDEIHADAVASQPTWKPSEPAARAPSTGWPPVPTTPPATPVASPPATSIPSAPPTWTARRRKFVGVAAVVVVLVAALVALGVWAIGSPFGEPSATATQLIGTVTEVAVDPAGGVYLGTLIDHRIFKVEPSGTIRTVAGTGTKGYSGDNGPATEAQLWNPQGLALDGAGNLYIADTANHRIRKIDPAGTITTIAGNGTQDSTGDGGPAKLAQIQFPVDVAIDRNGNLYVAEVGGWRVRKIDLNGRISTVAGTGVRGFSGDGARPRRLSSATHKR